MSQQPIDKIEQAIAEVRNALEDAQRLGAYGLFLALRERSQQKCRNCEPKLSVYEIAEEFDRLFPDPNLGEDKKHE